MDSILTSIKKLLGIDENYEHFDQDIIMHINSVFMVLQQLGVGADSYSIEDKTATWSDYLGESGIANYQAVKTYIYLKVRLVFDPPTSSYVVEAINNQIKELEWRFTVQTDTIEGSDDGTCCDKLLEEIENGSY